MKRNGYKKVSVEESESNFSVLSSVLFLWINEVVKIGSERALEQGDFLPLSKENKTGSVTEKLQTKWNDEKANSKSNNKKPKLWRSVIKMVSIKEAFIIISIGVLDLVGRIIAPLFLGFLVSKLMSTEKPQTNALLYCCALAMAANNLFKSICFHQYRYRNAVLVIKLCSGLKGVVYIKTCRLSKQALMEFTTGHVIDLVSNDVQRMEEAPLWVAHVIPVTFGITVVTCLVVYLIGWQALMGVLFQLFLIPYLILLSSTSAQLRQRTAAVSDQRISFMSEAVSGIRALKTHAWENEYRDRIKATRRNEISVIRKKNLILTALAGLEYASAAVATLLSVITLVLTGQPITAVNVFMLLAFMNILRLGVNYRLAYGLLAIY